MRFGGFPDYAAEIPSQTVGVSLLKIIEEKYSLMQGWDPTLRFFGLLDNRLLLPDMIDHQLVSGLLMIDSDRQKSHFGNILEAPVGQVDLTAQMIIFLDLKRSCYKNGKGQKQETDKNQTAVISYAGHRSLLIFPFISYKKQKGDASIFFRFPIFTFSFGKNRVF
jgi:hypothetical protein